MLLTLILCEKYSRNKLSKCKIYCINLRFRALFHTLESVVSPEGTIVRSGQEGKIVIRCLIWTLFHILFQMVSVNTWAREFSLNKLAKQPWNILNCCLFRVPHISQEAALVHFPWIKFLLHRTTKSCGNLMFDCEKMTNKCGDITKLNGTHFSGLWSEQWIHLSIVTSQYWFVHFWRHTNIIISWHLGSLLTLRD